MRGCRIRTKLFSGGFNGSKDEGLDLGIKLRVS